jgi:hypothetical protein
VYRYAEAHPAQEPATTTPTRPPLDRRNLHRAQHLANIAANPGEQSRVTGAHARLRRSAHEVDGFAAEHVEDDAADVVGGQEEEHSLGGVLRGAKAP